MDFHIKAWSAWLPEMRAASAPTVNCPQDSGASDLSEVPAMTRRRLSNQARKAFRVALDVDESRGAPCIFASRHGDLRRTLELINALVADESISPTQFSLSVHNAISGQYSIFTGNQADCNAIAAGADSLQYAVLEAAARLVSEPDLEEVLVVYSDDQVPEVYQPYCQEPSALSAIALLLSNHEGERVRFSRQTIEPEHAGFEKINAENTVSDQLVDLISFLNGAHDQYRRISQGQSWEWSRG